MSRHARIACVFVASSLLALGCANCDDHRPVAEQQSLPPAAEEARPVTGSVDDEAAAELRKRAVEPPSGETVPVAILAPLLPESLDDFVASGPAKQHTTKLGNGGHMPTVERRYVRLGETLTLEISDARHSPLARGIVRQMQGRDRSTESDSFHGEVMHGDPGLIQWSRKLQLARAGLLVNDRFLINVKVSPADSEDLALELMEKLDVKGIAALGGMDSEDAPEGKAEAVGEPAPTAETKP